MNGTKRKVTSQIKQCHIELNGYLTKKDLNILPLKSYDLLIGMEWLEKQEVVINCLEKRVSCMGQNGKTWSIIGKPKEILV